MAKANEDRLPKLRELVRYNEIVHTNPVQVAISDLKWIVTEIARLRYILAIETDGEECARDDSQAPDRTADGGGDGTN